MIAFFNGVGRLGDREVVGTVIGGFTRCSVLRRSN